MHRTMDTVSQFDYQGMLNSSQFQQEMDEFARQNGFPNISLRALLFCGVILFVFTTGVNAVADTRLLIIVLFVVSKRRKKKNRRRP